MRNTCKVKVALMPPKAAGLRELSLNLVAVDRPAHLIGQNPESIETGVAIQYPSLSANVQDNGRASSCQSLGSQELAIRGDDDEVVET